MSGIIRPWREICWDRSVRCLRRHGFCCVFCFWGGANTLAQAIWTVKQERSETEVRKFVNKLCVYTITDQDVCGGPPVDYAFSSHQWIRKTCGKDIRFFWDDSAWIVQNAIGSQNWNEYATHIQNHGNLGKIYPKNQPEPLPTQRSFRIFAR